MSGCYCTAPATTGNLCTEHLGKLRMDLWKAPETLRQLDVTVTQQAVQGGGGGGGSAREKNAFNEEASYCAEDLRHVLRSAAHDADPQRRARFNETPAEHVARALGSLQTLARHPGVHTTCQDLTMVLGLAEQAIQPAGERRVVGECGCGQFVSTRHDDEWTRCRYCGDLHKVADLEAEQVDKVRNHTGTLAQIAGYFTRNLKVSITDRTLRRWADNGEFERVGDKPPTYRVGDVMDAWERIKKKRLPGREEVALREAC